MIILKGDLENFDIDDTHYQILEKIHALRGNVTTPNKVKGVYLKENKEWTELSTDEFVDVPHRLHNLVKGIFPRKKTGYAQSLQMKPDSKWGLEIDKDAKKLLVNYNFGKTGTHDTDMNQLQKCLEDKIPIGLFMNPPSNEIIVLGLGMVKSRKENNFVIESFGMNEEESNKIKKMALLEYDRFHKEPEIDSLEKISWHKFISKINVSDKRFTKERKASESLEKLPIGINEIIKFANSTEWAIPDFQRYFVWDEEDVRGFLNSIFHGYYVGALLLWDVKGKEELGVIGVQGVEQKKIKCDKIVLDGQQRITSLNYAIHAPKFNLEKEDSPSYFYIDFGNYVQNIKYDEVIKVSKHRISDEICFEKLLFPLFKLENKEEWLSDLEDYIFNQIDDDNSTKEEYKKINLIIRIIRDRLVFIYTEFQFPQVILPNSIPIDAVAEIFERINSTGKELDTFDLFIVRLSRYKIKLRDLWVKSIETYSKINEYYTSPKSPVKKINRYILESLALSFTKLRSCKRKDILDLYQTNNETVASFEKKWYDSSKYVDKAIDFLENSQKGFGVSSREELPYESMIPILATLLREIDVNFTDENRNCLVKLKNWYWTSVFDVRYSSGVEGKKSSDCREMIEWFSNDEKIPSFIVDFRESFYTNLRLKNVRSKGMSKYKGVMCILACNGAVDFEKSINFEDLKAHKDHIFPKSKFKRNGLENSILNMTWQTSDTNLKKQAKLPSEYIKQTIEKKFKGKEDEFKKEVLESHLINDDAFEYMKNDQFEEFIQEREKTILEIIGNVIGVKEIKPMTTMTSPITPYTNLKIMRNSIRSCRDYVYWIDRYFTINDFDVLHDAVTNSKINKVCILLSSQFGDEKMKKHFKRFRDEMKEKKIHCEMRVMTKSVFDEVHDRFLISKNKTYNAFSGDTARRDQVAQMNETNEVPEYTKWWDTSVDIIEHIQKLNNDKL